MGTGNGNGNGNGNGADPNGHLKGIKKMKRDPVEIAQKKLVFISTLEKNGGIVSKARIASGLKHNFIYDEFKRDNEFASQWLAALEMGTDALLKEALRRAKTGVLEPVFHNGKQCGTVRKYSDTLLIFLLKQGEAQKKWRNRLIQAGNLALETIRTSGMNNGVLEEHIVAIQQDVANALDKISLI